MQTQSVHDHNTDCNHYALGFCVINAYTWCVLVVVPDIHTHTHKYAQCTLYVCELLRNEMLAGGKCKFLLIYVVQQMYKCVDTHGIALDD